MYRVEKSCCPYVSEAITTNKGTKKATSNIAVVKVSKKSNQKSALKAHCLDRAIEAYKYSQKVSVLDLAVQFESYLLT